MPSISEVFSIVIWAFWGAFFLVLRNNRIAESDSLFTLCLIWLNETKVKLIEAFFLMASYEEFVSSENLWMLIETHF